MASSESEASCDEDPNFAVICAFFEKFGQLLGVTDTDICQLQSMLENTYEVPKALLDLHVKLLRKIKKTVHPERWEKSIVKFSHSFSSKDAWEVERFGYKNATLTTKVRILKELLEAQFDLNLKFKTEINKLDSGELRSQPLGRDKFGHAYWFQSDDNYQIRVFKEDLDDEKWTLVARDRPGLVSLISSLSDGDIKISSDSAGNEDSNSLSEKPVIDTGQQDTDSKKTSDDEDSNLEKLNQNKVEEKPTGGIKIKSLSELMPSPKRQREEESDGTIFQKYKIKNLEIRVSKIEKDEESTATLDDEKDTVVGKDEKETVVGKDEKEPIVGEAIEEPVMRIEGEGAGEENESPVVGEVIEEEVQYVFGNGSGYECQTGNQPKENEASAESSGTISETRTTEENNTIPEQQNVLSLTKGDVAGNHVSEKIDLDNKTVNINEPKASEVLSNETVTKSKNTEMTELSEPKENIQGSKKETDNVDSSKKLSNFMNDHIGDRETFDVKKPEKAVSEPLCVKKFAYICGKDEEDEKRRPENENLIVNMTEPNEKDEGTNKNVEDGETVKPAESDATTETIKYAESTEKEKISKMSVITESEKPTEISETTDSKSDCTKTNGSSVKLVIKKNKDENSLDSNSLEIVQGPLSNPVSVPTDNTGKPETKQDSDSNNKESEVQPEVVFVSGRTTRSKMQKAKTSDEVIEIVNRPIKRAAKSGTKKKSLGSGKNDQTEEKNKANSAESSITNSPAISVCDNSVISMEEITAGDSCDIGAPEADPLAVSDAEGDSKTAAATGTTVSSFSLDFNDSPNPVKIPIVPSPMRAVRKRGREDTTLKTTEADDAAGKRMKLKGRRQVNTALRKSVEQRIEQLQGSSSESKESEAEQVPKSNKKPARSKKKKGKKKKGDAKPKIINRNPEKKNSRILAGLDINEDFSDDRPALRQSRRLAQIKIKEQFEPPKPVPRVDAKKKKGKADEKSDKPEKRKRDKKGKEEVASEPDVVTETKKKKRREKPVSQIFNEHRPWQSSSEDSEDAAEDLEEEEEIIEEDDVPLGDLKSDHEFSPESNLEEEDEECQPMKRARTAKKESDEEVDECPCQKCGKEDHPEWILLCDKCDSGWHCSCLRPPLLVIPEGDWFCPPCQHIILLEQLQSKLVEYDKKLSKKEMEDRRKERLAYVGISLNNVLPNKEQSEHRKKKRRRSASGSNSSSAESEGSVSESESDSDEPIYQLRQRRQTKNYKFNEYDEMIKTAIGEDANKPEDTAGNLGRGKDIQTIVKGLEPEPEAKDKGDENRPSVTNLKKMLRKKHRKLNSLEFDSEEEDISDEDFKGSTEESDDEEEDESHDSDASDDYMGRKRRKNLPVRRSTRARTRRYDADFIDDDSEDEPPRRKKKKSVWNESDTEESDASGYGPRNKRKKKKKKKKKDDSDDEPTVKKTRPRIKYGGLTTSEEEELGRSRRTRGKKTTYVDTLGSDSEEEAQTKKNPRKIGSESDEDFVANEDENDEDKDSEDRAEEEEEDEKDEDSEQERREKRSLLVPKIYIKKPLGAKKQRELEAARVKAAASAETDNTAAKKPEEKAEEVSRDIKMEVKESEPSIDDEQMKEKNESPKVNDAKPSIEINRQNEHDKSEKLEEKIKDAEFPCEEIRISENEIKKEVEEKPENVTELLQPKPQISLSECSLSLTKVPGKRGRKPKVLAEPIVSNVTALFKNDDENDDLSEPPGISLPLFDELTPKSENSMGLSPESPKKRRGRGPGKKKTLEESLSSIGTRITPTNKVTPPAIEIAAPPQPFSQAQPTPSVITRMLQSKPGISIYPVGRIRPKQFATMRDDDSDESSPRNSPSSSPAAPPMGGPPNQYNVSGGPRGPPSLAGPYRPHGPPHPGMNHYPRGPPGYRGPPPPQGMIPHPYSHHPSHRPMDPSPSGGGPINLIDPGPGPPAGGPIAGPARESPGRRGPLVNRFPPVSQTSPCPPRPRMQMSPQQQYPTPPSSSNGPPPPQQPYHPSPSSNGPPPPQQSYPRPPTSNSAAPPQQSYPPQPTPNNAPSQTTYHPPPSNNAPPPPQQRYPTPPTSSNGPASSQQSYSPPSNSGPSPSQQPYPPPPTSNNVPHAPQSPEGYYGNYPPPNAEEPMPPNYQGISPDASSPYSEQYSGEDQPAVVPPSEGTNSKTYDDESGGEFAGLASYFSSQRDDDLES